MATSYTTLLGLALPVQGELQGTWGDEVNNYITNYLDAAIAGTQPLTTDADVTLTKTTGVGLSSTSSQYAVLNCTGARTAARNITVPAASKYYIVINATTGGFALTVRGAGPTTGISIANGENAILAWNGSDFVKISSNSQFIGNVSIGGTPTAGRALNIEKTITGSTNGANVFAAGQAQSGVTSSYRGYQTSLSTAAAAFTVGEMAHFYAVQGTIGAGSSVTTQFGFVATSSLSGATNNTGYYSNIAAGATNWNFYANGAAENYFASKLLIGTTNKALNAAIANFYSPSGTSSASIYLSPTVQSGTTTLFAGVQNVLATSAAAFTLNEYRHFDAAQGTIGAGSAITTQIGFRAGANLTGAAANYGFYGAIPRATGAWNLYMEGTADNHLAGRLIIGATTNIGSSAIGVTSDGSNSNGNINSRRSSNDATAPVLGFSKSRGTPSVPVQVNSGDSLGSITFSGYVGTGYSNTASISVIVDGTPGTGDLPTAMVFSTSRDGAAAATEKFRLTNSGRIVVGGINAQGEALSTTAPARFFVANTQYTDIATAASTTVAYAPFTSFGKPQLAATNSSVTYTTAATVYIDDAPAAGANVTITNPFALVVNSGAIYLGGAITAASTLTVSGTLLSKDVIGYTTGGGGGAVTQATSRTTGVTLNTGSGAITLVSAAGTTTWQSFTITNSKVVATDTVIVNQKSGTDKYMIHVTNVSAGSFQITFATTGGTTTEQPVFNFAVVKAVTS